MRYIDDLLSLYNGRDPFTRKFFLAQVLDHPADAFSDEIVEFVWGQTASGESIVRRQARLTLGQYLAIHAGHSYGFVRTREELPTHATAGARELVAGAAHLLAPQLNRLATMMESGTPAQRVATSLVLGRLHNRTVVRALARAVLSQKPSYQAAFSLGETGDEKAVGALVRAVAYHGRSKPDFYMMLRALPTQASRACLEHAESRTDSAGRANIAMALAPYASRECRQLLERMIRRTEGWVTAYVLETLAGFGDPDDLPLVRLAYELEHHDFIREQAVRAAGTIAHASAQEWLLEVLPATSGRLQAAVLEALGAQGLTSEQQAEIGRRFLASEHMGTRVQAMLLLCETDPDDVVEPLSKMVNDQQSATRREAAFTLGHLQVPGTLAVLDRLARKDPSQTVRLAAIKSVGQYPVDEALPVLARLLEHPAPRIHGTACQALAGLTDDPGAVGAAIESALTRVTAPEARPTLLRALGRVARAGSGVPAPLADGLAAPDPAHAIGALEGVKYLGDRIPIERVEPLAAHADPRVRARAALVLTFAGRLDATAALDEMLASDTEAVTMEALGALMEIGLVTPFAGHGGFDAFAGALRDRAGAGEVAGAPISRAIPSPPGRQAQATPPPPSEDVRDIIDRIAAQVELDEQTDEEKLLGDSVRLHTNSRKLQRDRARAPANPALVTGKRNLAEAVLRNEEPGAQLEAMSGDLGAVARLFGTPAGPVVADPGLMSADDTPVIKSSVPLPRPGRLTKPSAPIPATPPAAPRRLMPVAGLAVCGALALVIGLRASGGGGGVPSPAASAAAPARLTAKVWSTIGACGRIDGDGFETLSLGNRLAVGRVGTRSGGKLELGWPDGSSVTCAENSEITLGGAPPVRTPAKVAPLVVADPAGTVIVDAKAVEVQVRLDADGYRLPQGRVRFTGGSKGWTIEQLEGDGTLMRGGQMDVLVPGQSRTLGRADGSPR